MERLRTTEGMKGVKALKWRGKGVTNWGRADQPGTRLDLAVGPRLVVMLRGEKQPTKHSQGERMVRAAVCAEAGAAVG